MKDDIELLKKEIKSLKDANISLRVQKDQAVREASARALDCDHHGAIIDDLERTLAHVDGSSIHVNQAYGILISELGRVQAPLRKVKAPCDQIAEWCVKKIDDAMKSAEVSMKHARAVTKAKPRH